MTTTEADSGNGVDGDESSLGDVLDRLKKAERGRETSVGDVMDALSDRSLGVIIVALGMIAALPLVGAIPGVSIGVAALVLLALGQRVVRGGGGSGLWLPAFLRRRRIDDDTFDRGIEKARPATDWIDARLGPRLQWLAAGPGRGSAMTIGCTVLALSMLPLAVVPWGVIAPALGLVAFGLAMIARDGLMALFGWAMTAVTAWVFLTVV